MNISLILAVHLNNHPSDDVDVKNNFKTDGGEILSPFDEKEEWNKITKIIDSFGVDIGNAVKKSTTPNNCNTEKGNIYILDTQIIT